MLEKHDELESRQVKLLGGIAVPAGLYMRRRDNIGGLGQPWQRSRDGGESEAIALQKARENQCHHSDAACMRFPYDTHPYRSLRGPRMEDDFAESVPFA